MGIANRHPYPYSFPTSRRTSHPPSPPLKPPKTPRAHRSGSNLSANSSASAGSIRSVLQERGVVTHVVRRHEHPLAGDGGIDQPPMLLRDGRLVTQKQAKAVDG